MKTEHTFALVLAVATKSHFKKEIMKIKPEIEVFDNGTLCANPEKGCPELYRISMTSWCHRYAKHEDGAPLVGDKNQFNLPMKCDECKAAYFRAKHDPFIFAIDWMCKKVGPNDTQAIENLAVECHAAYLKGGN